MSLMPRMLMRRSRRRLEASGQRFSARLRVGRSRRSVSTTFLRILFSSKVADIVVRLL